MRHNISANEIYLHILDTNMEVDSSEYTRITILAAGGLIHCVIPSFPVFSGMLREVKFQWEDEYGKIHVFDGFARHCNLLDDQLPAVAKVPYSYDNAFMIKVCKYITVSSCNITILQRLNQFVSWMHVYALFYRRVEFSKSVDTNGYQFFEGDHVFVIWEWEWLEDHSDPESNHSEDDQETDDATDNTDNDEEEEDNDEIPAITHSVTFKCIGSTKEARYQEVLALAKQKIKRGRMCKSSSKERWIILLMQMPLHLCAMQVEIGRELAT